MALQRAMLLNNLRAGTEYSYFAIQFDGKKWIAWFTKIADTSQEQLVNPVNKTGAV